MSVHLTESFTNPVNYSFPHYRLQRVLQNPKKSPVVLVACGSFSPVTYLHLRMFEMAKDYIRQHTEFEVLAGYLSPVSDMYKKPGLLAAYHRWVTFLSLYTSSVRFMWVSHWFPSCYTSHLVSSRAHSMCWSPLQCDRVHMCHLAAENTSSWLMVDPWEAFQSYQRTAIVLDHFDHLINTVLGGVRTSDGEHREVRVMLLAGSDLIGTMSEPGVWSYTDVCGLFSCYLYPGIYEINWFLMR